MPFRFPSSALLPLLIAGTVVAAGPATARSGPHRDGTAPSSGPPLAAGRPGFTVAVLGDAFAEALAEGLRDGLGRDSAYAVLSATHAPSGLADPGYDWPTAARALLAGRSIGAAVIMVGANDLTALNESASALVPGATPWAVRYGDRVEGVSAAFRAAHVPLTWVGLPIVEDDEAAAGYAALNGIVRDRCQRAGVHYVDSWAAFVDEAGRFDAMGPDRDGHSARLRTADGRDFTHDGVLKLASFVEGDLRHAREAAERTAAAASDVVLPREPAVDNDVNAQIRRELGLPALAPGRPSAAGPVIVLTDPPHAADGQLATASAGPAPLVNAGGGSLAERALVEGRPLAPKPGRIDDFTWPRR